MVEELSDDPGTHQLSEATPLQAQRVQHAMISASTAETLAECEELPADLGFTSGVVRQLGLTLIAFNYPHVYARAVAKLADGVDLEQTLSKVLGFSPTMLGISLGRKWGLAPELQLAMGDTQRWTESDVVDDVAARLVKVCQVGEALARANDPEHYPSALSDWTTAENEITAYLGPGGMQKVRARIEHNCAS